MTDIINRLRCLAEDMHSKFGPNQYSAECSFIADELAKGQEPVGVAISSETANLYDDLTVGTLLYACPVVAAPADDHKPLKPAGPEDQAVYDAIAANYNAAPADAVAKDAEIASLRNALRSVVCASKATEMREIARAAMAASREKK